MLAAIELELVKAAQLVAFLGAFRANKPKLRARPRNRIVPRVGGADHQSLMSFVARDDGGVGEDETGARPREAGASQAHWSWRGDWRRHLSWTGRIWAINF